ncbi:MAG: hypothetical protein OEZ06_14735 [Myxococcales bacterium]|nr:hypothetical protein [Myxococcales bacterium]
MSDSDTPATDDDFLDQVVLGDADDDHGDDDGEYGLELDDAQANEVRTIFFTTLPQYLEPIEEMIDQLFSGGSREELCPPLLGALSSIGAAAARIGIESVREPLERLQDEVGQLMDLEGEPGAVVQLRIETAAAALRELTLEPDDDDEDAAAKRAEPRGPTIFAAAQQLSGIDRRALEKLTAAGVVTLAQLRMAEAREVAAVTGLPLAEVETLIARLLSADSPAERTGAPGAPGDLRAQLRLRIGQRVEAEAELEEARARLLRTRAHNTQLEPVLEQLERRREQLRGRVAAVRERLSARLELLGDLRRQQAELEREGERVHGQLEAARAELRALRDARNGAELSYRRCAEQLSALSDQVRKLCDSTPQVRTSRTSTEYSTPPSQRDPADGHAQ